MTVALVCRTCAAERHVYPSQIGLRYKSAGPDYQCRPCWNAERKTRPVNPTRQRVTYRFACADCGEIKEKNAHEAKPYLAGRVYRCRGCFAGSRATTVTVACPGCGASRGMKKSTAERRSALCKRCARLGARSGAWGGGKVTLKCGECGVEKRMARSAAAARTASNRRYLCATCHSHQRVGENNPAWRGGVSFEPYPAAWTRELKAEIAERDNHMCQLCNVQRDETPMRFHVHHINYDKHDLSVTNLVLLCHSCHARTNFQRERWQAVFIAQMVERGITDAEPTTPPAIIDQALSLARTTKGPRHV